MERGSKLTQILLAQNSKKRVLMEKGKKSQEARERSRKSPSRTRQSGQVLTRREKEID